MGDMSGKRRKIKKGGMIGTAIVVIVVCLGFILDLFLGIGVAVGALVGYCGWMLLGESAEAKEDRSGVFLDTEVLRENFSIPKNMPIPYAVLDMRGHILMYNEKFLQAFPDISMANPVIEMLQKDEMGKEIPVTAGGRYYNAMLNLCDVVAENGAVGMVLNLTLVETTKEKHLEEELGRSETVIGMLFLDNLEEVFDTLAEDRQPLLSAVVDRKLTQFASDANGVMRKLEKDRYIFLLSRGDLESLKEKKFDIMNTIREISVGEHIPLTMSMGVGIGRGSLEDAMHTAKTSLDLALGRGGDQVVIMEGEKYLFYGAKSGEMGRNGRIRARVKADALWELMGSSSSILVMGHRNADLDSLGACMGICAIARAMDKKCRVVMNEAGIGVKRICEEMQENGTYDSTFVQEKEALREMDDKTLVIIVDTHRSSIVESAAVLEAAKKLVVFDHHRKSTMDFIENAVLLYHEPYASSTAELVTEMIQHIGKKIKLRPVEADALLAGITLDTKNFAVKTGAITFDAAGFLRRNGADSIRVRMMFQNDIASYKAKAAAVKEAELYREVMAISACPVDQEASTLVAAQAADDLMNVAGIKASFVCTKVGETIFISARSFGDVNVQRIMEKLGGGGHYTVSGAQLKDCTLEAAKNEIRRAIDEYLEEETA